jgi:hypothetical protein
METRASMEILMTSIMSVSKLKTIGGAMSKRVAE